jgi:glucose-6-phosphate isomerase
LRSLFNIEIKMNQIKLEIDNVFDFVPKESVFALSKDAKTANISLENGAGKGNDFLGWLHLPSSITDESIAEVLHAADVLRSKCEVVAVVGIGGSYLGAKSVIEALSGAFDALEGKRPLVVFAGHNIGEDYLADLSKFLTGKQFGIINISKSGTTTEPALAFRILKKQLETAVGKEEARNRTIAVTDASRGALRTLADREGYRTFVIPDNVGGRFSVFTPVGLLPVAVAGIDIAKLIAGAADMEKATGSDTAFENNIAELYAATRNALYRNGKKTEILANFNPQLHFIAEWWKQLYGESEGKEQKGIFNAAVDFTTDLHSMGQWIQEGERTIFETVISVSETKSRLEVPTDAENLDGLNYLAGKRVDFVNKMAEKGTQIAHVDGGVPNLRIELPRLDEYYIGQLLYFFERACGISGYILGVNPFDQPGVEAYKKNMFALLEKPGYEKIRI